MRVIGATSHQPVYSPKGAIYHLFTALMILSTIPLLAILAMPFLSSIDAAVMKTAAQASSSVSACIICLIGLRAVISRLG